MLERTNLLRPSFVALAVSSLLLAACQREQRDVTPEPAPAATPPTVSVAPPPALDRAGLLQAMDQAASAYAAGDKAFDVDLPARRFVVRQAIGCAVTAVSSDGVTAVAGGRDSRDLSLSLTPADWTSSPPFPEAVGGWEAAEGFWLSWPWLRSDGCPVAQKGEGQDTAGTPSPQTMGLAAVFDEGGSRLGRRNGRPYAYTVRGEGKAAPISESKSYRLVLDGRMAVFADGRAIRCHATGPEQRPVCIAAVRMERVAFENDEGQILSEWRG